MKIGNLLRPFLIASSLLCSSISVATELLREPSIQGDTLVFSYANDIWKVALSGGDPIRLTSFQGRETGPIVSPDGKWVTFSGEYEGNSDVYKVSIDGGEVTRLTYHPANDQAVSWSNDGQSILFSSSRGSAPRNWSRLFTIALDGGNPVELPMRRAIHGDFSDSGNEVVYRRSGFWDKGWRNYRGGQNQALRIIDLSNLEEYDLPFANDFEIEPIWQGDDIFYLSNRSKVTNVFKYSVTTQQVTQVTQSNDFDVMGFAIDGNNLVYEYHGGLYLQVGSGSPQKLDINVKGDFYWARDKMIDASKTVTDYHLSPTAKRAVFSARGDIYTVPAEHGSVRNLTNSSDSRQESPTWSPDGQSIAWFSDDSGEYRLTIADQFGKIKQQIQLAESGFYNELSWSPDNRRLIFSDSRQQLWIANTENASTRIIDQNTLTHPEWSMMASWAPDSKWVAYVNQNSNMIRQLWLYSVEQRKTFLVTDGIAEVRSPTWDKNGQRLYFLASTNYGPNAAWLDMSTISFDPTYQLYYLLLDDQHDSPLLPKTDEEMASGSDDESKSKTEDSDEEKGSQDDSVIVSIKFDGLTDRIMPVSKENGHFSRLQAGMSGKLFYLSRYNNASGSSKTDLVRFDMESRKSEVIAKDLQDFKLANNGETLLARMPNAWKLIDTESGSGKSDKTLSMKLQKRVNFAQEWQQIFREAWRYQRDYLYVDNFHGADWDAVYTAYQPLVADVKHPADLTYLLDNIGAEVSVGHSYTSTGELPTAGKTQVGLLGADLVIDSKGVRFEKILTGNSYFPAQNQMAPLAQVAHQITNSDYLLSVNGVDIDTNKNIYAYFDGTLGSLTRIKVGDPGNPNSARIYNVLPIQNDTSLRRNDWIERNRQYVTEKSNGKLAYVWIPNTADDGYHTFNRYFYSQSDRQGVILDERFNHGGYIADYVIDVLRRELNGFFNNPFNKESPMTSPGAGIWGSQVMLINEVSGSGGDMLPYMFRYYGLGKLVGKRTWGGLVGIWGVPPLIDGGYITAPRSGFYDINGQWKVENEGVEPDINVEQWTKNTVKGEDPQLDRAIAEALKGLQNYQSPIKAQPEPPLRVPNPN